MKGILNRSELLLGKEAMDCMGEKRVILFGVGGVGSWCAEGLIRSGVKHLTIVDSDRVCATNINRQLMATTKTVGQVKVEALRNRLLEINPEAEITAIQEVYSAETNDIFALQQYDYIIDCIDSLKNKIELLMQASRQPNAEVFSSMGAALKLDPTQIKVAEFWKVRGCPLGAAMRKRMRQQKMKLGKSVTCVYSEELLENKGHSAACGAGECMQILAKEGPGRADLVNHEWCSQKAQANGSLVHITAIFGFTLAGLIVKSMTSR